MNRKLVGIVVCTLLFISLVSLRGTSNTSETANELPDDNLISPCPCGSFTTEPVESDEKRYNNTFFTPFAAGDGEPTFVYETIIDGHYLSRGLGLVVDADGNAFVIASWYQDRQHLDILVIKLDPEGEPVWIVPIVGDELEHDYATDITLDSENNVWITGWTSSESFPTTPDALDKTLTGFVDAFIMKLSSEDGSILYSTFLGGDYADRGQGIFINHVGEIYVVGSTGSTDFPTTPDAYQGEPSAPLYIYTDAFITKISADGSTILYSTYFGGYKDDEARNVAVDDAGNIIFAGHTNADDFPLVNPIQSNPDSIYISKLSADGSTLLFSTYLGGEDLDGLRGMALDSGGFVYITGSTRSINFPTTPGAFQEDFVGEILGCEEGFPSVDVNCYDTYVTKLGTDGSGLIYSTFFGGSINDKGSDITVDGDGCAHIIGYTVSPDFLGSGNIFASIFISKLSPDGGDLVYALTRQSYSAGAGHGIAIDDDANNVYITGAVNAPADVYIAKITKEGEVPDVIPDVKANGSDGPIMIARSNTLSVTVSLNANGRTDNADWWHAANTPFGWYSYNPYGNSRKSGHFAKTWKPGLSVTYQRSLFDLSPTEVLNMSGLPAGTYTFYFGVDTTMDGEITFNSLVYDTVVVNITE